MKKPCIIIFGIILLFGMTNCSFAGEPLTAYGANWNNLNMSSKLFFLSAFRQGYEKGWNDLWINSLVNQKISHDKFSQLNKINLFKNHFELDTIKNVVSDIYKDPANNYLPFDMVIDIAISKLQGEPIDKMIEQCRKVVTINSQRK